MEYKVDIVMCIDVTGSMSPFIGEVKKSALEFWPKLKKACEEAQKYVTDVRVKVIAFRDFEADGNKAMTQSDFFEISDDSSSAAAAYKEFVTGLNAEGGGPEPENSLEALTLAMKSDWVQSGDKQRHVIVLFTDASAHKLEEANRSNPNYPKDMPTSIEGLVDLWNSTEANSGEIKLKNSAKRMIMFAPDMDTWNQLYEALPGAIHVASKAGAGVDGVTLDTVIGQIVGSI